MRRLLLGGIACAVAGVAMLVGASAYLCQNTLRVPHVAAGSPPGSTAVVIPARGNVMLAASFQRPATSSTRCVLVLHGIADNRSGVERIGAMLLAEHYAVLLPDSRAHGESGGDLITYGLLEKYDALDWVKWLRGQGCEEIFGLGESLGGSVLIQAAAVAPEFRAIVAECPYADLESVAEYRIAGMTRLPTWGAEPAAWLMVKSTEIYARLVYGIDLREVSPVTDIARTATPILLIHGMWDKKTPPAHSEALARANAHAALWLVPGAGHVGASLAEPEEFRRRVLDWFARH